MKKILAILLIPVFLMANQGVAITSLYCKGKLTAQGMNVKACCKDVNKGGCCDTKTALVKLKDNYQSASPSFEFSKVVDVLLQAFQISFKPEIIVSSYYIFYGDKAPPLIKGELYILFHSLII